MLLSLNLKLNSTEMLWINISLRWLISIELYHFVLHSVKFGCHFFVSHIYFSVQALKALIYVAQSMNICERVARSKSDKTSEENSWIKWKTFTNYLILINEIISKINGLGWYFFVAWVLFIFRGECWAGEESNV